MSDPSRLFFSGSYTYRRPRVLVIGLVAFALGAVLLLKVALDLSHAQVSLGAVLAGIVGTGLTFLGGRFLIAWLTKRELALEISTEGIRYGRAFRPWSELLCLLGTPRGSGILLYYRAATAGPGGWNCVLKVDHLPSASEYERLMDELTRTVKPQHPEILFGTEGGGQVVEQTSDPPAEGEARDRTVTLEFSDGRLVASPSAREIKEAVSSLDPADRNSFIILVRGNDYVQAAGGGSSIVFEYQEGDLDHHFQAKSALSPEDIGNAMADFAAGGQDWRKVSEWDKMNLR